MAGDQMDMFCIDVPRNDDSTFFVFLSSEDRDVVIVNYASIVGKLLPVA